MKSNLSRGKGNRIIYSAMRWFAIPKIAFLKSKTMYSPLLGKPICGAALCFPLLWPQSSLSLWFSGPCRISYTAHPGPDPGSIWLCSSGHLATAPTGSLTPLHPVLSVLVWLHLAFPALGCPGQALQLPLQQKFLLSEQNPIRSSLLTRHSWSSLSGSLFWGSHLFILSSCLSHTSALLVTPDL